MRTWTYDEVAKHASREDCFVVLYNKVYDLTEFVPHHPGGAQIILKYAGKDATYVPELTSDIFDPVHPPGTIEKYLPAEALQGDVDVDTVPESVLQERRALEEEEAARRRDLPPLDRCLNLFDFEMVARKVLSPMAWAYYSSAADDQETLHENVAAFRRIWFRPRILRNVKHIDPSTSILGHPSSLPIYMTATALGRLGHPDGELNLVRAAAHTGLIQMVPTLSSCSFDEIVNERTADGRPTQFFQLYVNSDRNVVRDMLRQAEAANIQAIFITVDAPQLGRREKDMRMHFGDTGSNVQNASGDDVARDEGAARAISSFIDPGLDWDDVLWIKSQTRIPLLLKGVQCWEDAVLAAEMGLAGVVLSNHGGRQLDFARSAIEVLDEVVPALKQRNLYGRSFQLFVDGGIRRGTDVLKAIAMGATAVGLGRPFIYASSAYGAEGVIRAVQVLRDEIEMNMRLIGAPTLRDLTPAMLDLKALSARGQTVAQRDSTTVMDPIGPPKSHL